MSHESTIISYSPAASLEARKKLQTMQDNYPATTEEKERSLGLFLRGSLLARFLAIRDIYVQIVDIPGNILDIGTWRGQTAVLCENLRAIYEPLHLNRRIACFDTFEGYLGFSDKDVPSDIHRDGTYGVGGNDYAAYLDELLKVHEQSNAMGNNFGKHMVIKGDCRETIPNYFSGNPSEFVALAFFDVNSYQPTLEAFEHVWERLVPNGIVAFWQLTRNIIPAEGRVYAENIVGKYAHTIHRCPTYPGLSYIKKI